jgi:GT2 family glycosyltransferase
MNKTTLKSTDKIIYAARITENSLFCLIQTDFIPVGKETIELDGITLPKPYLIAKLQMSHLQMLGVIIHLPENNLINAIETLQFTNKNNQNHFSFSGDIDENLNDIRNIFKVLSNHDIAKILYLMMQFANIKPALMLCTQYWKLCDLFRAQLKSSEISTANSIWLTQDTLFIPIALPENTDLNGAKLMLCSEAGVRFHEITQVKLPNNPQKTIGLLLYFVNQMSIIRSSEQLTLFLRSGSIAIQAPEVINPDNFENKLDKFIFNLRKLPIFEQFNLKSALIGSLLKLKSTNNAIPHIINILQNELLPEHISVVDIGKPFGINVELISHIAGDGILIAGWLFDPLKQITKINVLDDFGNYYENAEILHHYHRPDIDKRYIDSIYHKPKSASGFILWLPNKSQIQSLTVQLSVELASGIKCDITSPAAILNHAKARDNILNLLVNHLTNERNALKFVAEKLQKLQNNFNHNINSCPTEVIHYGKTLINPIYSLVIPLYKQMDFIQAQISHLAQNRSGNNTQIIYVLDSPEHAKKLKNKLHIWSELYKLPLTLVIMPENAGYANASNAGAKIARGEWLILMNSDILPLTKDWTKIMSNFLLENPKIGVVSPMLQYEDDSIQHAGIFFKFNQSQQFFENKHHYKGFPSNYPPAQKSRCTHAVSGACMMITRKLWGKIGGFCNEYIIGDYEDTDLCLKLQQIGYNSYYLSEVKMLHFERQSMSKNNFVSEAQYLINAHLHHQKWQHLIAELNANH